MTYTNNLIFKQKILSSLFKCINIEWAILLNTYI